MLPTAQLPGAWHGASRGMPCLEVGNNYLYSVPDTSVFPLGDLGTQGRLGLLLFHPEISTPSSIFFSHYSTHTSTHSTHTTNNLLSCLGPPPRPLLAQSSPALISPTNCIQALSLSGGWACPALQAPGSML